MQDLIDKQEAAAKVINERASLMALKAAAERVEEGLRPAGQYAINVELHPQMVRPLFPLFRIDEPVAITLTVESGEDGAATVRHWRMLLAGRWMYATGPVKALPTTAAGIIKDFPPVARLQELIHRGGNENAFYRVDDVGWLAMANPQGAPY